MVVRSTSWSENRLKWKAVFVNLFFLRHEKAQKNEEKLSPHPRLKTNYSNNNEKLMAAVRNAFCALRNVKEINWVILCFPRLLYPLLQHSLFVHMQNSRASRKTYLVACQKVFFFLCCVFFFGEAMKGWAVWKTKKLSRTEKCNFQGWTWARRKTRMWKCKFLSTFRTVSCHQAQGIS